MKTWLVVAGLLLALLSAVVGCGAFVVGLSFVEPPHASWGFPLAPPPSKGPEKTPSLSAGDHEVWIVDGGACTLVVRAGDGTTVGRSEGNACRVSGTARAGEIWSIEATGVGAPRSVYVGRDDAVFPVPLKLASFASVAAFCLALLLLVVTALLPRTKRAREEEGAAT